jgi:apolipoprotein D and lipocalin family protein
MRQSGSLARCRHAALRQYKGAFEMTAKNLRVLELFLKRHPVLLMLMAFLPFPNAIAMPDGASAITGFSLERYLGTWYEIARLDHRFERGLTQVTATYSLRADGGVKVSNRGYKEKTGKWSDAQGKAYFVEEPDIGRLKVSFFGPFYGAYNIIDLDQDNYSYALVIGNNTKYMWILARESELEPSVLESLLSKARHLGFATDELIYPQKQQQENRQRE